MDWKQQFKTTRFKKMGSDRLMEVAYHEAGHALVDLLLGIMPASVTIVPDHNKQIAGSETAEWQKRHYNEGDYLFLEKDIDLPSDALLEIRVLGLLGGIIGGAVYSGEYGWEGSESDLDKILDAHLTYGITDIPTVQPYWDKTHKMITDNRAALDKIASDLYQKKTLDADYFQDWMQANTGQ